MSDESSDSFPVSPAKGTKAASRLGAAELDPDSSSGEPSCAEPNPIKPDPAPLVASNRAALALLEG